MGGLWFFPHRRCGRLGGEAAGESTATGAAGGGKSPRIPIHGDPWEIPERAEQKWMVYPLVI